MSSEPSTVQKREREVFALLAQVCELDDSPVPKSIDFGIAEGLAAPNVTGAAPTGDRLLGTPAYMSPEALEPGSVTRLDARTISP